MPWTVTMYVHNEVIRVDNEIDAIGKTRYTALHVFTRNGLSEER